MTSISGKSPNDPLFGKDALETSRIEALRRYEILDTRPEEAFDRLTRLASAFFEVEVAFVAFLDADRQWFKSRVGLDQSESSLAASFCTFTIEETEPLVIDDARNDERVQDSPFVTEAGFRFYAGVPLVTPDGHAIGTFSIMDRNARTLTTEEVQHLTSLAQMVIDALENRRKTEEHKQVARRFEAVFEDPNVLAGVLAPDGTVLDTNETSLQYIAEDRSDVLGQPFWTTPWWPDAMREEVQEWVHRAADGEYVEYEANLTDSHGTSYSVDGTIRPVRNGDGSITSLVVSARDVTARTNREDELRRQRSLLEQSQRLAGAWEIDLRSEDVAWSKKVYEIHEVPPGTPIEIEDGIEFYAPEAQPTIRKAFRECVEDGVPYDLELPLRTAKGNRRWVRTVGAPAESVDGNVVKVAGAFQDITDRKEREQALSDREQKTEALYTATEQLLSTQTAEEVAARIEEVTRETFDYALNGVHFARDGFLVPVRVSPSILDRWPEMPVRDLDGDGLGARAHRAGTTVTSANLHEFESEIDYQDLGSGACVPIGDHGVISIASTAADGIDPFDVNLLEILAADAAAVLDRIEYDEQLERQNDLFSKAQEIAQIGAWEYDARTDENVLTDQVYRIHGRSPSDELSFENVLEYCHPDDRATMREAFTKAVQEGIPYDLEVRLITENGMLRWVRANGEPQTENGTVVRVRGTLQDITERKERERHLRATTRRLEAILEHTTRPMFLKSTEGKHLLVNESFRTLFGLEKGEAIGKTGDELFPPGVSRPIRENDRRVLEEEAPLEVEETVIIDGEERVFLSSKVPLYDIGTESDPNAPVAVFGVATDITNQKRRENELRKKERRYRAVFEDPNILVGLLSTDGEVVDINRTAMNYVDVPLSEIVGHPFWNTPWFDGDSALQEEVRAWIRRAVDGEYVEFEADLSKAVGTPLVISGVVRPVTDEDGNVTSLLVTDRDVTGRKQDRRKLERYREYTDRLLDASDDLFFVCDEDATLQRWNERVAEVTGYSDGELEGINALVFVPPEERTRTKAAIAEVFETGRSQLETKLVTKDGSTIPYEFAANCVEHPDGKLRLVGIGRDVTERKRRERSLVRAKEEAIEANRLKSAMLANMSHEIRTPLTSVTGFADVLEENLEGDLKVFAGRIYRSGKRLMRTLDSVLQLSKLEAGIYELEREHVSLPSLVEQTTEMLRPSADEKSITLTTNIRDPEIDGYWNETAVHRILENLLENAIKFTPEGGTVEVRASSEKEIAVIEVEDSGIGIREQSLSEIFEPFKQESEGLTREYDGSGLGLSIVKRLVEIHNGTVDVETVKGTGSRFIVRLPQTKSNTALGHEGALEGSNEDLLRHSHSLPPQSRGGPAEAPPIFRRMYRITADRDAPFEEKTARLIDLGCEYLGLPYGFLSRISDGTQEMVHARGEHPLLKTGATCPLSEAYCRKTLREETLLAIQDAPAAGWTDDPAYERFELGSYIGSKIFVDGELYGTICFAAPDARSTPFNAQEETFVELLSRWTSYELEQRRDKRRLQHQNEQLEQFAGVLSHDLRTPLNVAQGRLTLATELMEADAPGVEGDDPETDGSVLDHLYAVDRALDRMWTLIADMLALTWSDQEFDSEDLEWLPLATVATTSWEQIQTDAATIRVEDDLSVRAHEGRLRQLLENLFRNAVEHGGSDVSVTVGAHPDGFFVEDDGPGIPPEKQEMVFEKGYSTSEDGTGLGLPIAEAIARSHGWTLSIRDERTGGARFEISGVQQRAS